MISLNGTIIDETLREEDVLRDDEGYPEKAVYTSLRTYEKFRELPFKIEEHLERLKVTAKLEKEKISQIREWIKALLDRTVYFERFIKVIVTPNNTLILNRLHIESDPYIYDGVKVATVPLARDNVKIKSCVKADLDAAHSEAKQRGLHEALIMDPVTNTLTEGTRSNLLWVKDGVLYWCNRALSGITQAAVLDIAKKLELDTRQAELAIESLGRIQEIMVTNTTNGIVPVTHVDGIPIHEGAVGPLTKVLMQEFAVLTHPNDAQL